MSIAIETDKPRPFSAGISKTYKVRPLSSNCPTIVKHNVSPLMDNFQAFVEPPAIISSRDRPKTAMSTGKKFRFDHPLLTSGPGVRNLLSPISNASFRPSSAPYTSFVNFEFIQSIGKDKSKYEDKSGIKPMKKLKTENFHTVIYRVKQQKEILEQKISQLEELQKTMNRHDVWNTPQAAIVDNILEISAKTRPDSAVNDYLRREKEKEEEKKLRRKNMRPSSSLGPGGRSIKSAKSVADFFRDYDRDDFIQDILASPKDPEIDTRFLSNKDITEKINDYLDNKANFRMLVDSSKELISNRFAPSDKQDMYSTFPVEEEAELHDQDHQEGERVKKLTIETSLEAQNFGLQGVYRIGEVSTARGDVPFDSQLLKSTSKSTLSSPKGFLVIHSRPQTAKKITHSTPNLLTKDLTAIRDAREKLLGTLASPREGPLCLIGSRVIIKPFKESQTKSTQKLKAQLKKTESKDLTLEQKVTVLKKEEQAETLENNNNLGSKLSRPRTAVPNQAKIEFRPMSAKETEARSRLQSAKSHKDNKSTIGTQTVDKLDSGMNKIYIDGEYFNAYSYPMDPELYDRAKKNVLQSWISNARGEVGKPELTDGDSQSFS